MPKKQSSKSDEGMLVNAARAVGGTLGKLAAKVGMNEKAAPAPKPARKRKATAKARSTRRAAKKTSV